MTITIDTNAFVIMQSILILFIIGLVVLTIVLTRIISRLSRQLEDSNRLLYFNMRDSRDVKETMKYCKEDIKQIQDNVKLLSSGLQIKIQQDREKASKKVYPKPDVARMITETIREQVTIEMLLSKNLSAPSREYVNVIAQNVSQTYPEIHQDYIAKKCLAVIEDELRARRQ